MSKKAAGSVDELLKKQEGKRVVEQVYTNTDSEMHVNFGKFMGLRLWGNGPHICLSSDAPGNAGFTTLVIYREDVVEVAKVFAALSEHVQAQQKREVAEAKEVAAKELKEAQKNANVERSQQAS